jgi:hypothetical protein
MSPESATYLFLCVSESRSSVGSKLAFYKDILHMKMYLKKKRKEKKKMKAEYIPST